MADEAPPAKDPRQEDKEEVEGNEQSEKENDDNIVQPVDTGSGENSSAPLTSAVSSDDNDDELPAPTLESSSQTLPNNDDEEPEEEEPSTAFVVDIENGLAHEQTHDRLPLPHPFFRVTPTAAAGLPSNDVLSQPQPQPQPHAADGNMNDNNDPNDDHGFNIDFGPPSAGMALAASPGDGEIISGGTSESIDLQSGSMGMAPMPPASALRTGSRLRRRPPPPLQQSSFANGGDMNDSNDNANIYIDAASAMALEAMPSDGGISGTSSSLDFRSGSMGMAPMPPASALRTGSRLRRRPPPQQQSSTANGDTSHSNGNHNIDFETASAMALEALSGGGGLSGTSGSLDFRSGSMGMAPMPPASALRTGSLLRRRPPPQQQSSSATGDMNNNNNNNGKNTIDFETASAMALEALSGVGGISGTSGSLDFRSGSMGMAPMPPASALRTGSRLRRPPLRPPSVVDISFEPQTRHHRLDSDDGFSMGSLGEDLDQHSHVSEGDRSGRPPGHRRKVSWGGADERILMESLHLVAGESSDDRSHVSMASSHRSEGSLMEAVFGPSRRPGDRASQRYQVVFGSNHRLSLVKDLETGREGVRAHRAMLRSESNVDPQSAGTRRRRGISKFGKKLVNPFWGVHKTNGSDGDDDKSMESQFSMHGRLVVNRLSVDDDEGEDEKINNLEADERGHGDDDDGEDSIIILEGQRPVPSKKISQYRLESLESTRNSTLRRAASKLGIAGMINIQIYDDSTYNTSKDCKCFGFRPNTLIIQYLNWTFRSSFFAVILSATAAFFILTGLFALVIMWVGFRQPECVHVNGQDFGTTGADFLDAYALSWTTFSTVGYGLVYPATSAVSSDIRKCTGIAVLTALESFMGILFASMWGAIFFSKVTRVASVAPIEFSDPMVIRFGTAVMNQDDSSSEEEAEAEEGSGSMEEGDGNNPTKEIFKFQPSKLPCPLLEFRVLNLRSAQQGGEIIDAALNLVASIDENQASQALRNAVRGGPRRRGKRGKRRGQRRGGNVAGRPSRRSASNAPPRDRLEKAEETLRGLLSPTRTHQTIDEDPTGKLIPRKIFVKLEVESPEHPFFKRTWLSRHVLDQHSPLLKQEAKELIRLNGGKWPMEMNSPEAVRASVHFDQIVVSLSGTSNADANNVYSQKVYEYADLCVGYRFCDILFRENDGSIGVDHTLLNDVREQRGGGGEDLQARTQKKLSDVLIL